MTGLVLLFFFVVLPVGVLSVLAFSIYMDDRKSWRETDELIDEFYEAFRVAMADSETPSVRDYEALGLPDAASYEQVRAAYRKLALRYHPDSTSGQANPRKFEEIKAAHDRLEKCLKVH